MSLSCGRRPARSAGEPGSRERMYWPGLDFSLCRLKPYPVSTRTRLHSLGTSSDISAGADGTTGASWERKTHSYSKLWFEDWVLVGQWRVIIIIFLIFKKKMLMYYKHWQSKQLWSFPPAPSPFTLMACVSCATFRESIPKFVKTIRCGYQPSNLTLLNQSYSNPWR